MNSRSSTPEDTEYWVALDRVSGLGPKKFDALERAFPTMEQAWSASPAELTEAGLDQTSTQKVIERRDSINPDNELSRLDDSGVRAITRQSSLYPTRLAQIYDPPAVTYVRGALTEADGRSVAVTGTRARARPPLSAERHARFLLVNSRGTASRLSADWRAESMASPTPQRSTPEAAQLRYLVPVWIASTHRNI